MLLQHCADHLQTDPFQLLRDLKRASKLINNWLAASSKANSYKLRCKQKTFLSKYQAMNIAIMLYFESLVLPMRHDTKSWRNSIHSLELVGGRT